MTRQNVPAVVFRRETGRDARTAPQGNVRKSAVNAGNAFFNEKIYVGNRETRRDVLRYERATKGRNDSSAVPRALMSDNDNEMFLARKLVAIDFVGSVYPSSVQFLVS